MSDVSATDVSASTVELIKRIRKDVKALRLPAAAFLKPAHESAAAVIRIGHEAFKLLCDEHLRQMTQMYGDSLGKAMHRKFLKKPTLAGVDLVALPSMEPLAWKVVRNPRPEPPPLTPEETAKQAALDAARARRKLRRPTPRP